jgi:ADP-heptose:LPS heptosyltransferase
MKFLFVRQDRIGDVLVSTPLLHALKERYPLATVDFLLSTNNHFVLQNEPLVRKRWGYERTFLSALRILRGLRQERYDFVIDLMDNPSATSTIFCALAGGKWNVGLAKQNAYSYDIVVPLLSRKDEHIVDRLAMLLTVFGLRAGEVPLRIRYNVAEESRAAADKYFGQSDLDKKHVIGINISPGSGTRFWGTVHYQGLIRWLKMEYADCPILILYQPSDKAVAQAIAEPFPDVHLSPETRTFDHFAAFVEKLWILITPDTSAVHLAAAFEIPAVVLFVQSDKELRVWEPYKTLSESVITAVDDLKTIPVADVTNAVRNLVKTMGKQSSFGRTSLRSSQA